jgi:hypothetical protein
MFGGSDSGAGVRNTTYECTVSLTQSMTCTQQFPGTQPPATKFPILTQYLGGTFAGNAHIGVESTGAHLWKYTRAAGWVDQSVGGGPVLPDSSGISQYGAYATSCDCIMVFRTPSSPGDIWQLGPMGASAAPPTTAIKVTGAKWTGTILRYR